MSLSDCEKCLETPCICGWDYRNMTKIKRIELASVILSVSPKVIEITFGHFIPDVHQLKEKQNE